MAKYGLIVEEEKKEVPKEETKRKALGTADYMAPEILQIDWEKEPDETVDWWAVGVIAFEFTTGGLPFNAKTKEDVFANILNMRIKWPDLNPDGSEWIDPIMKSLI